MAAAGLAALFRGCMESLKSILVSQEFGEEYELLCAELSLQCLRFRLWGNSVGMNMEGGGGLIISERDVQPTFNQTVSSIAYLLHEVEELRRNYQLKQAAPTSNQALEGDAKPLHPDKALSTFSSLKPPFILRRRMRENRKQKSFLTLTKWAMCDARRFDDKVRKLKCLIDGLEDITKAARLAQLDATGPRITSRVDDENPPPYSTGEPLSQPSTSNVRRLSHAAHEDTSAPTYSPVSEASLSLLSEYVLAMKRFLCVWPDEPRLERPRVRSKLLALSHQQFLELSEDVYCELLRRQQYGSQANQFLPPQPSLHPKRIEARQKLTALHVLRFPHLVADTAFEFDRRFPNSQIRVADSICISAPFPDTPFLERTYRWGLCPPSNAPPLLQYQAAYQSTNTGSASPASIPSPTFREQGIGMRNRNLSPLQIPGQSNNPQTSRSMESSDGTEWTLDNVVSWLASKGFSSEWQETFKALNIYGTSFLELGRGHGNFISMHQQVYHRLEMAYVNDWDSAREREEGKRLQRLIRGLQMT